MAKVFLWDDELALGRTFDGEVVMAAFNADRIYGELTAHLHDASYTFERAMQRLEKLLDGEHWREFGHETVNEFIASLDLAQFASVADQRKRISKLIKEQQPQASNRAIAKAMNVAESTVREDRAPEDEKRKKNNEAVRGNRAHLTSGADAARSVLKKDEVAEKHAENENLKNKIVPFPVGRYGTIVIDPPWEMEKIKRDVRPNQIAFDYPIMTEDELLAFDVRRMAADDCHLFCWTTQKHLPISLEIVKAWGFKYTLLMTWFKSGGFQPHGLPQYNSEFVVYARRGDPSFRETTAFSTCFQGERREHSRKPVEFYNVIRRVTADGRIDVFSREEHDGFTSYGNETQKFAHAK